MISPGAAAGPRGASGLGEVPLPRARALATCLPSLHSSMGNRRRCRARGWRGWWLPAGVQAVEAGRSTSSARPTACGSRPLAPTLGLLPASCLGAIYGGHRAGGAWLPGARVGLRHGGCLREARAPELAWCCRWCPLEGGYTQGVWIAP